MLLYDAVAAQYYGRYAIQVQRRHTHMPHDACLRASVIATSYTAGLRLPPLAWLITVTHARREFTPPRQSLRRIAVTRHVSRSLLSQPFTATAITR